MSSKGEAPVTPMKRKRGSGDAGPGPGDGAPHDFSPEELEFLMERRARKKQAQRLKQGPVTEELVKRLFGKGEHDAQPRTLQEVVTRYEITPVRAEEIKRLLEELIRRGKLATAGGVSRTGSCLIV